MVPVPIARRDCRVTPEFSAAAMCLVRDEYEHASPPQVGESVARACEQLSRHLGQLVGETGVRALFVRSVAISSATYPWLANTIPRTASAESTWASLRTTLENQDPQTSREAFVALLSTFVGLLERLIGEGLVTRLLNEIWPEVFPRAVKEAT
jgi:hypothetical protein